MGERGELGSGCSPGSGDLPDGIWFGWIAETEPDGFGFDLACLWPGRLEPGASNDATRVRRLSVTGDAMVYLESGETVHYDDWGGSLTPAVNAPGLDDELAFWVFVNDGAVTELSEYPEPVVWAISATAWPGLVPGCCDMGDIAPPSPSDAMPESGWPADGFYKLWPEGSPESWIDTATGDSYEVTISRWISCAENPGVCPDWWTEEEVIEDPSDRLDRTLSFDEDLTVVIMPIIGDDPLVGDGIAFRDLLADMHDSLDEHWPLPQIAEVQELDDDPAYPFGLPGEGYPVGYRGPSGTYLTWGGVWMALEIRDGLPILYVHAGLIAG